MKPALTSPFECCERTAPYAEYRHRSAIFIAHQPHDLLVLENQDKADLNADNEIKSPTSKDTKNNNKSSSAAATGSTSNINLIDEKIDKNLHLTEAQKEELEDLENKEAAAKKKAYLMGGTAVPELSQDNKTQSKSEFKNKFHTAKQTISLTEQRFNEEREAYENRRNRPIQR
ncbi:hypothetical protein QY581_001861 [Salmonella enterica]|nr:hypothetical protein [Salmonella enterica]ELM2049339.1 hypothetical protein [Salmonella enterica]ELQ1001768.1 hypothetical protein [Salmonella enterica]